MKKLTLAMGIVLLLAGCTPSDSPQGDLPRIMTDASGKRWIVQHHFGGNFTVKRIVED